MLVIRKGNDWYEYGGGAQTTPTDITVADESSDTTCFPLYVTAATGDLAPKSGSNLAFNSSSGILTATGFAGALTGAVTGNADTATSATTATNVTVADESSDTSCNVLFATAATGNLPPKSGTNLTFNSSSGLLTATLFAGDLTVAVSAFPVTAPVRSPANNVAVNRPELELNVKFVPDFGGKFPVAAVANNTLQDVSDDSSATVTFVAVVAEVAVSALPVTAPVNAPANPVAVNIPELELNASY
jgi:hypothetical protein